MREFSHRHKRSIATVSLSGGLAEKFEAAAVIGFGAVNATVRLAVQAQRREAGRAARR